MWYSVIAVWRVHDVSLYGMYGWSCLHSIILVNQFLSLADSFFSSSSPLWLFDSTHPSILWNISIISVNIIRLLRQSGFILFIFTFGVFLYLTETECVFLPIAHFSFSFTFSKQVFDDHISQMKLMLIHYWSELRWTFFYLKHSFSLWFSHFVCFVFFLNPVFWRHTYTHKRTYEHEIRGTICLNVYTFA